MGDDDEDPEKDWEESMVLFLSSELPDLDSSSDNDG